jgi:hypothetical protein
MVTSGRSGEVDARLALGRITWSGSFFACASAGLRELERQRVLAQRDLDLHARVGRAPEDLGDARDRLALAGRVLDDLDDDDVAGLARAAIRRGHDQVLRDAPVLGDDEPHAALVVQAPDDLALRALEHLDDLALRDDRAGRRR